MALGAKGDQVELTLAGDFHDLVRGVTSAHFSRQLDPTLGGRGAGNLHDLAKEAIQLLLSLLTSPTVAAKCGKRSSTPSAWRVAA